MLHPERVRSANDGPRRHLRAGDRDVLKRRLQEEDARISLFQDPYKELRKVQYEVTHASKRLARTG